MRKVKGGALATVIGGLLAAAVQAASVTTTELEPATKEG